jgi:uncharacterized repeat protein (TIGR01451 family)
VRPTTTDDLDRMDPAYGPYTVKAYPRVVDCTYPSLPAGTTVHDTITGTVDPALAAGSSLPNQTAAYATTYDPDVDNNTSAVTSTTEVKADLAVTKTADRTTTEQGDSVTFTVTVTNHGPSVARDVTITDTASGLKLLSSDPSAGRFQNGKWTLDRLDADQRQTLTATYRVTGDTAQNTAAVASEQFGDTDAANDVAAVALRVRAAEPGGNPSGNPSDEPTPEPTPKPTPGHTPTPGPGDNGGSGGNGGQPGPAQGPGLAATGNPVSLGLLGLAAILILGGLGAVLLGRRGRTQ